MTFMAKQMIQAIRVHQYGGPEQLKLEQIPCPKPQAGEVLLRVHAAGGPPAGWKIRPGLFKKFLPGSLPYIPRSALSGVVEGVCPGVATFPERPTGVGPGTKCGSS